MGTVLFTDDFETGTVASAPASWTITSGAWTVRAAPAGMTGQVVRAAQHTTLDQYLSRGFTRQTSGVIAARFQFKTGSNVGTNYRWCDLWLRDGATDIARVLEISGNLRIAQTGGATTAVVATAINTVYSCVLFVDIGTDKCWIIVNGTKYDNAGANYNLIAATTGLDSLRSSNFSASAVGGEFQHFDAFDVTQYTSSAVPGAGTLGAGTVDEYGQVTMTLTEGTGDPASVKVYRSNDGTTFADVTSTCTTTDNGSTWTIVDRRPHYGSEAVTYGGTGYYKVVGVNVFGDGTDSNTVTVASIDVDITTIVTDRVAILSTIMGGTSVASSSANEPYPGYWVTAMAYAYYLTGTAQYKTDLLNQFAYIQTLDALDDLIQFPDYTSAIFRDHHCRTLAHCAIAARLLRRAGATTDAATIIAQCDIWLKAFFDNLNSGNPAPDKSFSGWDANDNTLTGNQLPWVASTAYTLGLIRKPTVDNNRTYRVTTAGTSGGTEPTWTIADGGTVTDGTVVWTETRVTVACSFQEYSTSAGHTGTFGLQWSDLNQNAEEALCCALLLTDSTSDFYTAGTYRTLALDHATDTASLILAHETSTGAIPIGTAGGSPTSITKRFYDTLYGNYTLQQLAGVQKLLPTLDTRLPGYISRALSFSITNYYGTEPVQSVRQSVAEPGLSGLAQFYDLVYLDAAAQVNGTTNPQAKLAWTAAFQIPASDKVGGPYSATGSPASGVLANALQAEMLDGVAYAAALLDFTEVTKTYTADAVVLTQPTKTYTADAVVVGRPTKTYTADAIVTASGTGASTKTYTADAVIVSLTQTATYTADAVITPIAVTAIPVDVTLSVVPATDVDLSVSEATTVTLSVFPA